MHLDEITYNDNKEEIPENPFSSSNDSKGKDMDINICKYMGNISTRNINYNFGNELNTYNYENTVDNNLNERTIYIKKENKENFKSTENLLINNTQNSTIKNEQINKKDIPPTPQYTSKEIKDIMSVINIDNKIKDNFIINEGIINLEEYMSDETFIGIKRRNRTKPKKPKEDKKKPGRKKKDDPQKGKHTKHSNDNMIKKIKSHLLDYLILFVNNILNSLFSDNKIKSYIKIMKNNKSVNDPKKEDLIKHLDYNKIMNKTEKQINLKFLKMPLKDFLSQDISEKYKTLDKNTNKRIIEEILINENDNEIINCVFKRLTLGDWIDIFTYKKELENLEDLGFSNKENNKFIMDNFIRVDKLLEKIYDLHNGDNYFSRFIIILYNFERWFYIKIGRKRNKEEK